MVTYPTLRDWLFSIKTFAASILALYLALILQLPRPYWAMASVYVVSNPFVGATRSKALHRMLGTALGAAAAVVIVPPFVETPLLFSVVVGLWSGTMLYLAISERTARSYVFMLAGYTMPMIALPTVTDPTSVFDLAVWRTGEITLGIICASVVGNTVLPARLAPALIERADAWFRDAGFYGRETLSGHIASTTLAACRQRLAAAVNGLELLLSQLSYDHANPKILARAEALRGRMQLFLPMVSALADPLITLMRAAHARPPALDALLADAVRWFDAPLPMSAATNHDDEGDLAADGLRTRIAALKPSREALTSWEGVLLSNVLWRLAQLIDVWQDCRTLRALLVHESGTWQPRYRHWRLGGTEPHFDRGMMLFSALSAAGAIVFASGLWISSGWHDGAGAVMFVAIACCLFAAVDEPAPMVFRYFLATVASVVIAGLYLFVVLPHVDNFPMLTLLLAGPFILVGTLIPHPQFNMVTVIVAATTASLVSIQGAYDANFLVFVNSNVASVAGLLFAYIWTRVTRPFGAELAARRLLRASWSDVALSASTQPIADQRNLASRMLDRLMQLIPRLGGSDSHRHPSIESFRDLHVAMNALDLRRSRRKVDEDLSDAIDRVLARVSEYYASCAQANERQPAPHALIETIDDALGRIAPRSLAPGPEAARTAPRAPDDSPRWLHDTAHALVGLRLSLFPSSPAQPARRRHDAPVLY